MLDEGHTLGQQFVLIETARPTGGGVGSIWKQLEAMARISDEIVNAS